MKYVFTLILFLSFGFLFAQNDDLLSLLGEEKTTDYATATFKTTKVVNTHSIENNGKGVLNFIINHRFGQLNGGAYELFGLDQAYIRFGFEYGITDRLNIGVGRNSYEKVYDGFVKYKILRQSTGKRKMPISLVYVGNMDFKTTKWADTALQGKPWLRAYYTNQLLIARKFSEGTSIQIMPTIVHRNLVNTASEKNDVYLIGIGGRQKISKRVAINFEYYYALPNQLASDVRNSLSLGVDIETGGHVFQLFFTNSTGTDYRSILTETTGKWGNGGIHFGFNVSRVFTIINPIKE